MRIIEGTFPAGRLRAVPEVPVGDCLTHLLGHVIRAARSDDRQKLAAIGSGLQDLQERVLFALSDPQGHKPA